MDDKIELESEKREPVSINFVDDGILWLINRVIFHPRGFALGVREDGEGNLIDWQLLGNGKEVWVMGGDLESEDRKFEAAEAVFAKAAARRSE